MKARALKRKALPVARAIDGLTRVPLDQALRDAERFICPYCTRPVKRCLSHPDWICTTKWNEGTVLSAVRRTQRVRPRCIVCDRLLGTATLRRNPLAEVCPSCRRKPFTTPHHPE